MAYTLGHDILISVNGTAVAGQQHAALTLDGETVETTTKSDFPHRTFTGGVCGWHVYCTGLVELADAGLVALEAAVMSRTPVTVVVAVGSRRYTGQALVAFFAYHGPQQKAAIATAALRGTGALTIT